MKRQASILAIIFSLTLSGFLIGCARNDGAKIEEARPSTPAPQTSTSESTPPQQSAARVQQVRALAEKKEPGVVEPLIATLSDKDPLVRTEAAKALGEIKDNRAVEPLIGA